MPQHLQPESHWNSLSADTVQLCPPGPRSCSRSRRQVPFSGHRPPPACWPHFPMLTARPQRHPRSRLGSPPSSRQSCPGPHHASGWTGLNFPGTVCYFSDRGTVCVGLKGGLALQSPAPQPLTEAVNIKSETQSTCTGAFPGGSLPATPLSPISCLSRAPRPLRGSPRRRLLSACPLLMLPQLPCARLPSPPAGHPVGPRELPTAIPSLNCADGLPAPSDSSPLICS